MENLKKTNKFFISYYADTTLPIENCHKGLQKFSIRKRSKFFDNTEIGREQGLKFFKECKYPITKEKNLLFLLSFKEGIKRMTNIKREQQINILLNKPEKLDLNESNVISFEELQEQLGYTQKF